MHNLDLAAIKNLYSYLSNHIICEAGRSAGSTTAATHVFGLTPRFVEYAKWQKINNFDEIQHVTGFRKAKNIKKNYWT